MQCDGWLTNRDICTVVSAEARTSCALFTSLQTDATDVATTTGHSDTLGVITLDALGNITAGKFMS